MAKNMFARQSDRLMIFTEDVGADKASLGWMKLGVDEVLHGCGVVMRMGNFLLEFVILTWAADAVVNELGLLFVSESPLL
jgi:hypothetical protein